MLADADADAGSLCALFDLQRCCSGGGGDALVVMWQDKDSAAPLLWRSNKWLLEKLLVSSAERIADENWEISQIWRQAENLQ